MSVSMISFFLPVGRMVGRPPSAAGSHSTSSTSTPQTLPFLPMNRFGSQRPAARASSSWLEVVFRTTGHCGQGVASLWPMGRLWHDFYLRHARGSLPDACPDAVRTCVTAADDEHPFAFGIDKLLFSGMFLRRGCGSAASAYQVQNGCAFQFTTGDDKVAGGGCAGADGISVEACGQASARRWGHSSQNGCLRLSAHPYGGLSLPWAT